MMALTVGLMAGFASTALAYPSENSQCSGCHSANAAVVVTAVPTSTSTTSTTYTITVNNPYGMNGWAVFNGSSKVTSALGNGKSVVLPDGATYTIFGVSGDGTTLANAHYGSTTVSPKFPDTTAPTTLSDAVATYLNSATIHLTAADNIGGSGVAHTYYILDAGTQAEGTTVTTSTVGAHTLEFWSVDASANVETPHKTANFTVTVPVPDVTAPTTTSDAKPTYVASASIKLTATDNVGGSGVAHTYYILDAGTQAEGTTVNSSVVGTHTLEFWSVDASTNIETPHNVANFAITAAPPVAKTYTYTYKFKVGKKVYKKLKAVLQSKTTGKKYSVLVSKKGVATFKKMPAGRYKLSTTGNKKFKFKAKTIKIG
jgi:hypothetical protein